MGGVYLYCSYGFSPLKGLIGDFHYAMLNRRRLLVGLGLRGLTGPWLGFETRRIHEI